jgi:hypothetical protein
VLPAATTILQTSMTEPVVPAPQRIIGKHFEGASGLLKSVCRSVVTWVFVGVKPDREFSVGFCYLSRVGSTLNAQDFVITSLVNHLLIPPRTQQRRKSPRECFALFAVVVLRVRWPFAWKR